MGNQGRGEGRGKEYLGSNCDRGGFPDTPKGTDTVKVGSDVGGEEMRVG